MIDTILKIDIDEKPFKRKAFDHKIVMLAKELGVRKTWINLKSTARGTHAVVILSNIKLKDELIVASQLYLGSDSARELFNIGRVFRNDCEMWNVLFCNKWKNGRTISKETNLRKYSIDTEGK